MSTRAKYLDTSTNLLEQSPQLSFNLVISHSIVDLVRVSHVFFFFSICILICTPRVSPKMLFSGELTSLEAGAMQNRHPNYSSHIQALTSAVICYQWQSLRRVSVDQSDMTVHSCARRVFHTEYHPVGPQGLILGSPLCCSPFFVICRRRSTFWMTTEFFCGTGMSLVINNICDGCNRTVTPAPIQQGSLTAPLAY